MDFVLGERNFKEYFETVDSYWLCCWGRGSHPFSKGIFSTLVNKYIA